jgi:hypothetical protein
MLEAWVRRNTFHDGPDLPGGGVDTLVFEDRPHRARCDRDTELLELALDTPIAPGPVLLCEADDEATNIGRFGGPPDAARIGPTACNEPTVPGQDRLGANEEGLPAHLG